MLGLALAPAAAQEIYYPSEAVREQAYFEICDHDLNGWISYREAVQSLQLSRPEFPIYDDDRDGRISREEFATRYQRVVDQTGAFPEPLFGSGPTNALSRNPEQILHAFDQNADRSIGTAELAQVLAVYDRGMLSPDVLQAELDRDGDGKLQGAELSGLARVLTAPLEQDTDLADKPTTIDELFGEVIPRDSGPDSVPQPPRIPGPVPHFRRLDLDNDGLISMEDLRRLQAPLQVNARIGAVWATLDTNGDGAVDFEEFRAAL
jgi:hypothetical protein